VLHDVFIYPYGGGLPGLPGDTNASASENGEAGFLIEADAAQMDSLARYIKRYKLRAKVTIRRLQPGEISVWQAWDENPGTGGKIRPSQSSAGIILEDPRAPGLGYRVLQAGDRPPELDLDQVSEGAYTVRRYLRGVPEGQQEIIKEHALPQESNMDLMNAIDFRKGCYVGQELTIRTRHRGVVRKRILPCVVYGVDEPAPQSLQYDPDSTAAASVPPDTSIGRSEKRGRSAGKWLRGIGNIGLGLCRLEVMTGITLPGETAATAYQPDHEFVLQWGDEDADKTGVKVKAFVPNWIKNGLDEAAASHG
jgi:folate-binding protein YgfZ